MELIKKKILLESLISRKDDSTYGTVTANTIYVNVFLTQDISDLGMFTDMPYVDEPWDEPASIYGAPNTNNQFVNKLVSNGILFPFMCGSEVDEVVPEFNKDLRIRNRKASDYFHSGYKVTGFTNSRLGEYVTTNRNLKYINGFDVVTPTTYVDMLGNTIFGHKRITNPANPDPTISAVTYVSDAENDVVMGTKHQKTGFLYTTYPNILSFYSISNLLNTLYSDNISDVNTTITYVSEGWNSGNTTLSAITKEEKYLGIISVPEIQSDVFIDRGTSTPIESHLRLSEITSVDQFATYNGGYFKIIKT